MAGDLTATTYSDGTPAITRTYRRDGQPSTATDAAGAHSYEYANPGGVFSRETISGGTLDGLDLTVLNGGVAGQRTSFSASRAGQVLQSLSYGYDTRSRLAGVSSGGNAFTYTYAANSDQVASVASSYRGNQVLDGQRIYDNNQRLDSITYRVGANVVSMHDYQYDLLHRRTKATRGDAHYWSYGYNDRNEVTSARKFAPDDSGLPGWGSAYAFDAISNRLWADRGGDSAGANMRRTSYTANSLNQYTGVANPGGFDVLGQAVAAASVTVNAAATERKGDLFRKEITVDNSSGIVREPVNITATLTGAGLNGADVVTQRNGNKVVRSASETLTHDLDGNLLSDDRWNYSWNGENRLIAVETSAAAVAAGVARRKWEFDYDSQGRRIRKAGHSWDGAAWVLDWERLCVYDGWHLVAELDGATGDLVQRYTWGLDVSGTIQGAGGVGGLLSMEDFSGLPIPLYYTYDGNGNVMALVRATDGAVVAEYEYSAFGELLRAEGEASGLNPWRHATKYQDGTGLLYYGFRYYDANSGRWLSRDPSGEIGGSNLYGFVNNDGVNEVDLLGLWEIKRRSNKKFAIAQSSKSDTIDSLARMIGFDPNEYKEWLTDNGGGIPSNTAEDCGGCSYKIPNKVVAYWGGDADAFGRLWISWKGNIARLKSEKFMVQEIIFRPNYVWRSNPGPPSKSAGVRRGRWHFVGGGSTRYELHDLMQNETEAKTLHGIYFWGHGWTDGVGSNDGPKLSPQIQYSALHLSYGLPLGWMYACYSDSGKPAISSNAPGHDWIGSCGILYPILPGVNIDGDDVFDLVD